MRFRRLCGYASMRICCQERYGYRAWGFLISDGWSFSHGFLFSHPIPLGIEYFFHGFLDVSSHRVWGVWYLVLLLLPYPCMLKICVELSLTLPSKWLRLVLGSKNYGFDVLIAGKRARGFLLPKFDLVLDNQYFPVGSLSYPITRRDESGQSFRTASMRILQQAPYVTHYRRRVTCPCRSNGKSFGLSPAHTSSWPQYSSILFNSSPV